MSLWWQQLVLVMAGGAVGAAGRYLIGGWMLRHAGNGLPWGTLAANLLGSLLAGFLLIWLEGRGPAGLLWRAFLMVGVLGALTTWSALMIELYLLQRGPGWGHVALYLGFSLAGGVAALLLGIQVARWLGAGAT
ncbi:CrcB family protein [Pseudomarimonas salicorniae]|uniref:Fluoride-specific ion channel FluC n=1 Tax=Pseudomarimonas salicorniae TaxID=2933270 RepID=A0ABT0GEG7_9GAMM|nr:CrcB family protein [Lysobacter sp. CAU 1642]MCK7592943.1 CrcB family protein [Lysobacter sp. CAU 1642]